MKPAPWWVWTPALLAVVVVVGVVAYGFIGRIAYPYDLEWMEGGQLAHAWRVAQGLPLYPEPGPEWVPYVYTPGYSWLVAALSTVFGLSAPLGRAVSWFGTGLGCASIAWVLIRKAGSSTRWVGAAIGVGAYLSCWVASGTFLDLVRPDALAVGLLLASIALSLEERPALQVLAGLCLASAFWCKHPLALFGLPLTLGLWARSGRVGPALRLGVSALVPAVGLLAVQQVLEPNFLTYLVSVPASHGVVGRRILPLTPWEIGAALPVGALLVGVVSWRRHVSAWLPLAILAGVAVVAGALGFLYWPMRGALVPAYAVLAGGASLVMAAGALGAGVWTRARGRAVEPAFWWAAGLGVTALLLAGWMRGHTGGFTNVHLPAFGIVSMGIGWAVTRCRTPVVAASASLLIAGQLGWSAWSMPVQSLIPGPAQVQAGDRLVAELRQAEGPVWSPAGSFVPVLAGHPPGPHLIAVWDVANYPKGPFPESRARFEEAVSSQFWGTVVQTRKGLKFGVAERYRNRRLVRTPPSFRPRWGWRDGPYEVWVAAPGRGASDDGAPPGR